MRQRTDARNYLSPLANASAPSSLAPLLPAVSEGIATFTGGCTTAESRFTKSNVVCAKVSNFSAYSHSIYWVNPDGAVVQTDTITAGSPTSTRQVIAPGVWHVYLVGYEGEARDFAAFSVSDPDQTTFDMSVYQESTSSFSAGGVVTYTVLARNAGADDATGVQLDVQIPNNATYVSSSQDSGPSFTCTPGAASTACTIATLPAGSGASFTFFYQLSAGATSGQTISSTVTISDSTTGGSTPAELHPLDNFWSTNDTITGSTGSGTCSIACPDSITKQADTVDGGNQPGSIVHFSSPVGNDDCGAITVDHCNDCFFPVGDTVVTATTTSGESCSFTVTVTPANGQATISCPADITGTADSNCEAVIAVGTPTATGSNVTVFGVRSDGKPMYNCDCFSSPGDECDIHGACTGRADAPFAAGTTTIVWTAVSHDIPGPYADPQTEEAHRTGVASCVQTITVADVTPPTITPPSGQTASADANCQAAVPDFAAATTVADNCGCASSDTAEQCQGHTPIAVVQSPAPGTLVGLGPTTVTLTATDEANNSAHATVTFTVVDTTPPTFTFVPANVTAYTGAGATTCDTVVDPGTATATDNCGPVTVTRSPSGNTFPVGTTTITWTAKDGANNTTTATQTVTVIDNTVPVITLNGNTPSMWPPNHKYTTFGVGNFVSSVFDNCGGVSVSNVVIAQVTSDETENGNGDGNTLNDIVIGSDCKSVQLRSERDGGGNGRVYTITFRLTDTHGNSTTATAQVVVPHNPGQTPVDSGVHYTVNGSCP